MADPPDANVLQLEMPSRVLLITTTESRTHAGAHLYRSIYTEAANIFEMAERCPQTSTIGGLNEVLVSHVIRPRSCSLL